MEPHTFTTTGTSNTAIGYEQTGYSGIVTTGNSNLDYGTITNFKTSGTTYTTEGLNIQPFTFSHPVGGTTLTVNNTTNNRIMQNKVAIFKVTRDEDEKIIKTEFLKEMWVETKNGQTVDFQVARDKDLAGYEMSDLIIKTIFSLTF
jgi:hypothetical protein